MNLSARNGWLDEECRVYIIFTIEEIKDALGCAEKKAVKLLDELEKKCGLIERKRQGLGKPNLIYVKNFVSGSVERQFLNCQKDNSGAVKNTIQEMSKEQGNNTDTNYIDFSDIDPFFPSGFCRKEVDETDEFTQYYSKKFFEEHRDELMLHKAAKQAFDQLDGQKVPSRQALHEEFNRLLVEKKQAYGQHGKQAG